MQPGYRSSVAIALVLLLVRSAAAQQTTPPVDSRSAITSSQSDISNPSDSQARIVRLSEVTGEVQVDRGTGTDYEPALLNLPIVEGCKLRTAAGFAEVEFEDGSTLRLTPFTAVEFDRLRLQPSGSTVSTVHLDTGTVYVSTARTKGNEFTLGFANQNLVLTPSSHVRVFLKGQWASVSALHGKVTVDMPNGATTVSNRTMNLHLVDPIEISQNKNAEAPYDGWDEDATQYHDHYAKKNAYGNTTNSYGIADMSYYGSFMNAGGCGVLWRPYFAGPVWDPFADGSWVWYPAWGYSWVSPYPWGWTAYHYGSWAFCPDVGWGWQPLGWRFRSLPIVVNPPVGYRLPQPPPRPRPREPQVVTVNRAPAIRSHVSGPNRVLFRRDSAGLGVPRATFSLNRASERAQQQGSSTMKINPAPVIIVHEPGQNSSIAGRSGTSAAYLGGHSGHFGRPGSYSGGHAGSSSSSYSGGHASGGYSGGGYSGGGGHSSGSGGGAGGHGGR